MYYILISLLLIISILILIRTAEKKKPHPNILILTIPKLVDKRLEEMTKLLRTDKAGVLRQCFLFTSNFIRRVEVHDPYGPYPQEYLDTLERELKELKKT